MQTSTHNIICPRVFLHQFMSQETLGVGTGCNFTPSIFQTGILVHLLHVFAKLPPPPRMTMGSCGFNGILRVIPEMKTFHVLTSQRDLQHRNGRGREGGSNTSCIPPPSDLTRGGMSGCVSCQPGSSWVLQMPHRVASKSLSSQTQNSMGGRRQTLGRSNCKNSWEIGQTPTWNGNTRVCPCLLERCCFIISRHCLEEGT